MPMEKLHRSQLIAEFKNDFPELIKALNAEASYNSLDGLVIRFCKKSERWGYV